MMAEKNAIRSPQIQAIVLGYLLEVLKLAIDFEYNENACREVIKFYQRKVQELSDEIKKLELDKKSTNEKAVIAAFDDYIGGLKAQISGLEAKIKDVQSKQGT